jgi:hypothetical protein
VLLIQLLFVVIPVFILLFYVHKDYTSKFVAMLYTTQRVGMLQDCKSQVEKKQLRKQISITQCFGLGMDLARQSKGE